MTDQVDFRMKFLGEIQTIISEETPNILRLNMLVEYIPYLYVFSDEIITKIWKLVFTYTPQMPKDASAFCQQAVTNEINRRKLVIPINVRMSLNSTNTLRKWMGENEY